MTSSTVSKVCTEVVYERRIVLDLFGFETELLGNDPSDLLFDTTHGAVPLIN
jgi:hypothetical protein